MADSVREQIIAAVLVAVSGIYRDSGLSDDDDLPICVVQDEPETAAPDEHGVSVIEIPMAVAKGSKVSASADLTAQRKACHELLASIIEDMFADETFGGLADGIEYTGGGIVAESGGRCLAEAQFTVRYETVRGDPYTPG